MVAERLSGPDRQRNTPVRRRRTAARLLGLAGTGIALVVSLTGCSVDDIFYFGWPKGGITQHSQRMFDMWIGSAIAALVVGVFVWALIFWCVVRYRKRGEELPPQTRYNLPIELLYSVAPFLVISVLFYYTAIIQTDVNKIPENPDVTISVTAFKWNWEFSYDGQNGPGGVPVSTVGSSDYIPVLVVPVNKTIVFKLHAEDVIHSFWVPEILFKRDVFPGNVVNKFAITVEQTGPYVGRCAELCGTYHSMMNFELRAVTPEQYEKFITAKKAGKTTPEALAAAGFSGKDLYATTTVPFETKRDANTAS
ncbi:cytochrome c oxidase subunit II [Luedemannella flava]|uniref:aa3-type cytochrome oxidase subunit II n=1 Tax=Luedemannella flava TaxID=349316 RepID=UPI003613EBD4